MPQPDCSDSETEYTEEEEEVVEPEVELPCKRSREDAPETDDEHRVALKKGRKQSPVWDFFEGDMKAPKIKCIKCGLQVNVSGKVQRAIQHLYATCTVFRADMHELSMEKRPAWYRKYHEEVKEKTKVKKIKPQGKQPSMRDFVVPKLTTREQQSFDKNLSMFFYMTGTSYQRIDDPYFEKAMQLLRPSVTVPTRQRLATSLLDSAYDDVRERVIKLTSTSSYPVTTVTDGWTDIKNDSVVNYMACNKDYSLFIESVKTGEQRHTGEWIANDIARVGTVIDDSGGDWAGTTTDNTAANKLAWAKLVEKYPTKFFQGCSSHCGNLCVKDLLSPKMVTVEGSTEKQFPANYPFCDMYHATTGCKGVVKYFSNHHKPKAKLERLLSMMGKTKLVKPAATRWCSMRNCFANISDNIDVLRPVSLGDDFIDPSASETARANAEQVREFLQTPDLARTLKKAVAILEPFDFVIMACQSDSLSMSDAFVLWNDLPSKIAKLADLEELEFTDNELNYAMGIAKERWEFIYGDAHGLAYLLDPRYIGDALDRSTVAENWRADVESFLYDFPESDSIRPGDDQQRKMGLYNEYQAWFAQASQLRERNDFRYQQYSKHHPSNYWRSTETLKFPMLCKIAQRVMAIVPSSASSERNFSTYGFVHSKLRNSLSPGSVEKLVYIKTNALQVQQDI